MLASIIANLQNVPQAETRLPTIKIDRGGGGATWPNYDIVDIMTALQLFPEIAGEHAVARAVRRTRWIGEALPRIKEAREQREGAAFLAGATVADAAAEERHKLIDQLKIEHLVEIIDEVRGSARAIPVVPIAAAPAPRARGQYVAKTSTSTSTASIALGVGVGLALGLVIARSFSHARRPRVHG